LAWIAVLSDAFNQEQILLRLIEEIKELTRLTEFSRLVSQQVNTALHLTAVRFLSEEGETRPH